MSGVSYYFTCLSGPALNKIYRQVRSSSAHSGSEKYIGNAVERYGGIVMSCISTLWSFSIYTSPFILTTLYRRDMFTPNGAVTLSKFLMGVCIVYVVSMNIRALGRATNPTYKEFLGVLTSALRDFNPESKRLLQFYDFEFSSWPVEFSMKGRTGSKGKKFLLHQPQNSVWQYPLTTMSWLMVHTFGIKLVYPGSIGFMKTALADPLQSGREKWILEKKGVRYKLETTDGNHIDTMFFDRRNSLNTLNGPSANGKTLVVSCEGNAGFYEIGVLSTPMDAGYSVLGWNHPGFGGSTGTPYPEQETNAIDTVMQFAIDKLGFTPDQIIIHGWSIGGFPASWVAMNFPDIKAVVLDATFDDLLPLAVPRMPEMLEPLVKTGVSQYINLNVAEQLIKYNGPIRLIRRSQDEMISTDPTMISSNRGNFLLEKILLHRYPHIFSDAEERKLLAEYLSAEEANRREILSQNKVDDDSLPTLINSSVEEWDGVYPCKLGQNIRMHEVKKQLVLFLATKYMVDFDSSHCTPLPVRFFNHWDPLRNGEDSLLSDSFEKI